MTALYGLAVLTAAFALGLAWALAFTGIDAITAVYIAFFFGLAFREQQPRLYRALRRATK